MSLLRLSQKAGVKNLSDDCYDVISELIKYKTNQVINIASEISLNRNKKMIMPDDLHFAFNMLNMNVVKIAEPSDKIFSVKKE